MRKFIWIIIGIIVYFGLGWIAKDIVFSMIEITDETTLKDLTNYEFIVYSIVAAVMSFIGGHIGEDFVSLEINPVSIISISVLYITWIIAVLIPLSTGLILLYNIVNIGAIIVAIYTNDNIG